MQLKKINYSEFNLGGNFPYAATSFINPFF